MKPPLYPDDLPLAYLLTFSCYGTWLHGDERGSVDPDHNLPGTPVIAPNTLRQLSDRERMTQPPFELDEVRRETTLGTIREVCDHRGWPLMAVHVRTKHVHSVVQAATDGDTVINTFKAYASRNLNSVRLDAAGRKRWTRGGSVRKLWMHNAVEAAIHYVVHEQGEPMAVFEDLSAIVRLLTFERGTGRCDAP
jgi:REP element-mobilizing transposase RayT